MFDDNPVEHKQPVEQQQFQSELPSSSDSESSASSHKVDEDLSEAIESAAPKVADPFATKAPA